MIISEQRLVMHVTRGTVVFDPDSFDLLDVALIADNKSAEDRILRGGAICDVIFKVGCFVAVSAPLPLRCSPLLPCLLDSGPLVLAL